MPKKEKGATRRKLQQTASEAYADYQRRQKEAKEKIKAEPSRWKRFWKWCLFLFCWPFKWIWMSLHDVTTVIIFAIVVVVLSSEVWVPYLLGVIFWGTDFGNWMIGIGTACWVFWLGPFTPFLAIAIFVTIGIKNLIDRIRHRGKKKEAPVDEPLALTEAKSEEEEEDEEGKID